MCFSPQRRTIFQHVNFQKWSRIVSFLTFSLPNVLFATAACNFSTCQLPKVVRDCGVLLILTCECVFRHSGVQFLMSPLSTYLRTRRFNRPTFGLTRHANVWKNAAFRDFSNIWRGRIFFLLTFWLLHLLSTDLTTLLLLFNSPYCRKFLFKLPSTITIIIIIVLCSLLLLLFMMIFLGVVVVVAASSGRAELEQKNAWLQTPGRCGALTWYHVRMGVWGEWFTLRVR